ncbi:unnamed protein product [Paramecium sonneborni]|uniref:Uncharacterized protein n=1 Tax=Paramecium sonneborni TaxID=65129 RepID=A0A8S1N8A4_9CILI|nr:unnamed protein product [Paramecium sonneborni]
MIQCSYIYHISIMMIYIQVRLNVDQKFKKWYLGFLFFKIEKFEVYIQCVVKDQQHKRWSQTLNKIKVQDKQIDVKLKQLNYFNVEGQKIININIICQYKIYNQDRKIYSMYLKELIFIFQVYFRYHYLEIDNKTMKNQQRNVLLVMRTREEQQNQLRNYQQIKDTYGQFINKIKISKQERQIQVIKVLLNNKIWNLNIQLQYLEQKKEIIENLILILGNACKKAEHKQIKNGVAKSFEEALKWILDDLIKQEFNRINTKAFLQKKQIIDDDNINDFI